MTAHRRPTTGEDVKPILANGVTVVEMARVKVLAASKANELSSTMLYEPAQPNEKTKKDLSTGLAPPGADPQAGTAAEVAVAVAAIVLAVTPPQNTHSKATFFGVTRGPPRRPHLEKIQ